MRSPNRIEGLTDGLIAQAKSAINNGYDLPLHGAIALEKDAFAVLFSTQDAHEGMGAFVDKRDPIFKGR